MNLIFLWSMQLRTMEICLKVLQKNWWWYAIYLRLCNQIVIIVRRRIWNFFGRETCLNDAYSGDSPSALITMWFESQSMSVILLQMRSFVKDVWEIGHGAAYSWSLELVWSETPNLSFSFRFSSEIICNLALNSSLLVFNNKFYENNKMGNFNGWMTDKSSTEICKHRNFLPTILFVLNN